MDAVTRADVRRAEKAQQEFEEFARPSRLSYAKAVLSFVEAAAPLMGHCFLGHLADLDRFSGRAMADFRGVKLRRSELAELEPLVVAQGKKSGQAWLTRCRAVPALEWRFLLPVHRQFDEVRWLSPTFARINHDVLDPFLGLLGDWSIPTGYSWRTLNVFSLGSWPAALQRGELTPTTGASLGHLLRAGATTQELVAGGYAIAGPGELHAVARGLMAAAGACLPRDVTAAYDTAGILREGDHHLVPLSTRTGGD